MVKHAEHLTAIDELGLKQKIEDSNKEAKLDGSSKGYWGQLMHYFTRYDRLDSY